MTRFFLLLALSSPAHAGRLGPWLDDAPVDDTALTEPEAPTCRSRLVDGVQLPERPELYTRWNPDNAWGTPYLVDTLVGVAEEIAAALPAADPIAIGDLSRPDGGPLFGHLTHDLGIDADIGLFLADGRQATPAGFEAALPRTMDVEATWTLIRALLETERIQYILLDHTLITELRRWLAAEGILTEHEIQRIFPIGGGMGRPGVVVHAPGHKDHLHVRVRCAAQ